MYVWQSQWNGSTGLGPHEGADPGTADLVLLFGSRSALQSPASIEAIRNRFPKASLLGCSTAGEIHRTRIYDDTVSVTAIRFDRTRVVVRDVAITSPSESEAAGAALARSFDHEGLVHLFVLSDGLNVNGSELVRGISDNLPASATFSGGLSADGEAFGETVVVCGNLVRSKTLVAAGFYGDIEVGCASLGGWDSFGPERLVTKSAGNILYDLDGKSALELYKRYLGDHATMLPGSGLLFPLSVRNPADDSSVVRTILAINEETESLTFAGDVPQGWYARLMKANFDRLVDGAIGAARNSVVRMTKSHPELAILISCVGRRMVLRQRTEEELEGVRHAVGPDPRLTGFYSYGEISPLTPDGKCALHNQTMTITCLREIS
ncbi:MAG TPA: FIST N-terminal domain-containing protein [Thermoanaerobaculia bacterium]|nr:FIST N-terminal domain-containing protein [Thermoanaerobaculia bacterium]